jgi:hypothetical protein
LIEPASDEEATKQVDLFSLKLDLFTKIIRTSFPQNQDLKHGSDREWNFLDKVEHLFEVLLHESTNVVREIFVLLTCHQIILFFDLTFAEA